MKLVTHKAFYSRKGGIYVPPEPQGLVTLVECGFGDLLRWELAKAGAMTMFNTPTKSPSPISVAVFRLGRERLLVFVP